MSKKTKFIPVANLPASWLNPHDGAYADVKVLKVLKRTKKALIRHPELIRDKMVHLVELEEPLNPDVNTRFKYYDKMLDMAFQQKITSLVVVGRGGIGKSFQALQRIGVLELEAGEDYKIVKGYSTPKALYETIFNNNGKVIMFDDCDSITKDANALNILKSVLDSQTDRTVSWLSSVAKGSAPSEFVFTGTIVFLSNKDKEDFDQTILSRAVMIDLHMTPDELIDRMALIIDYLDVGDTITTKEKRKILQMLRKYQNTIFDLNLRTLRKAITVYEDSRDMELVRYQILNG